MKRLAQPAAAYLLNVTARWLRDQPDAPRNGDGTYDAAALVAWFTRRMGRPALSDEDMERLCVCADTLYSGEPSDGEKMSIIATLRDLRAKYGEEAWLIFVDLLIDSWHGCEYWGAREFVHHSKAEIRKRIESEYEEEREGIARSRLMVAFICYQCGKLRRGRRWIKAEPPAGYVVANVLCPDCEAKEN